MIERMIESMIEKMIDWQTNNAMLLKSFTYGVRKCSIENITLDRKCYYFINCFLLHSIKSWSSSEHALYLKALNIMFRSNKRQYNIYVLNSKQQKYR